MVVPVCAGVVRRPWLVVTVTGDQRRPRQAGGVTGDGSLGCAAGPGREPDGPLPGPASLHCSPAMLSGRAATVVGVQSTARSEAAATAVRGAVASRDHDNSSGGGVHDHQTTITAASHNSVANRGDSGRKRSVLVCYCSDVPIPGLPHQHSVPSVFVKFSHAVTVDIAAAQKFAFSFMLLMRPCLRKAGAGWRGEELTPPSITITIVRFQRLKALSPYMGKN